MDMVPIRFVRNDSAFGYFLKGTNATIPSPDGDALLAKLGEQDTNYLFRLTATSHMHGYQSSEPWHRVAAGQSVQKGKRWRLLSEAW
jgi:hypothetical protein